MKNLVKNLLNPLIDKFKKVDKFDITDQGIEKYYADKADVAPRVLLKDIEDAIESIVYFTALDGIKEAMPSSYATMTAYPKFDMHLFCIITLKNGFQVSGENICVSRKNYNRQMGEQFAKQNAMDKLWLVFGYELTDRLYKERIA